MKLRQLSTARLSFPLASALAALLASSSAHASNLYWDTNGTGTAGSGAATGTWGTDAFWTTDSTGLNVGSPVLTAATNNTDDLFFSAGANGTAGSGVAISGTQSAHSITTVAGQAGFTITGGTINLGSAAAGSGMSFANVGSYNFNSPIILDSAATAIAFANKGNQVVTFGATGTIAGSAAGLQTITIGGPGSQGGATTFNGIISNGGGGGTVALTVNAASTTTLAAANTYTGATNLIAGTLQINNTSTFTNTSAINLFGTGRLIVNGANSPLAKLAPGTGSGVVAGSFLRYLLAQTSGGTGPGTIFGTVELSLTNVNPNYTLDFGSGSALTNLVTSAYTSPLTLSGSASIDSSTAVATYTSGGITSSTAGSKILNLTGTNTGANTISSSIDNGSGTIALTKGGGGNWTLSGTNTYTGNTGVDAGTLQFTNQVSLYNNGAAATWTKNNIIVGNGATMAFNVGGAGQFSKTDIVNLLAMSDSASNGFTSGSNVGIDTTGGSLLFDSVIANTNGGSNVLGLTKLGTNTLTLDQNNTYTGRTFISGGTLQLGNGSTTGKLSTASTILNNGNLTINRSDTVVQGTDFSGAPITGTGSFTQAGGGTTTLNTVNTFSGTTTVSAGVLNLTNALALQNSAIVTTGSGSVTFTGFTTPSFGGLSGATGDLSTIIPGFSSSTSLTLNPLSGSVTYGGAISDGAGGLTLTKNGAGTQILSGTNLYTGATVVNAGTLTVSGSLSSSSTLQMGGGTFNYGNTSASQTVNGLTINAGNSTVNNTAASQTLTLGVITRTASVYGMVNFATLTGFISTTTGNINSILGPWATTGSTTTLRYAVGSADGITATNISALTGTTATANTLANVTDATGNFEYSAAVAAMLGSTALTANTLRYSGAATATAINATSTLSLNGLMNAGTGLLTVSGGPTTGGILIGSTNELVVTANAQATTISAVIANGGAAGRVVYSGGGILTLSGANTYSGGLVINSGTVTLGVASTSTTGGSGTGAITVNNTGSLRLITGVGTLDRAVTVNGGSLLFNGSGTDLTLAGTLAFGANSTIDAPNTNSGFPTISANTSGAGGFTKTNVGGLRLNGTNNYEGPTVISAGGLTVKSSLYGNDTSKWTPANITVASGATLMLNVSSSEFTIAQAATMFSQLSTNVTNNGLLAGSIIGVDTRNASAGTYTYSSVITDSTGSGGGSVSFKHTGVANTILELTGANTYSGTSVVDNGSTLKVSSLNSVFTNAALGTVHSASSSLGAPTTVANGTIHLGTGGGVPLEIGNTFIGGNLTYTGTGETTDRVISLNGGGNETYTLDQSGTGNLKFLSSFAMRDNRSVKTINFRGSTAGTGELAGTIPNAGNGNNNVTKNGTGTWILSGTNLYTGTTTINASGGTLRFAKQASLYNNTEANWIKTNIIVNSGATLALNVGGTGEFTTGNVTTLRTNLSTSITNNGLRSGSAIGFDTTNASGGSFTIADTIANSTGTGSGAVGLTKLGTNKLVLTGPNTYSGATTVTAGTLLVNNTTGSGTGAGNVSVSAGTLGGTGSISGTVTIGNSTGTADSILAPGNSIGTIATGNLSFSSDGTYACEVNGSSVTSDQTSVTGTVTLDAATTLTVSVAGSLAASQKYFIVVNDGVDAVTGTFASLAQDAVVGNYGGTDLKISYTGDSGTSAITGGNDIVLYTDASLATAYDTWASLKGLTVANNAKNLDPDNDGRNNLAEFAFDGDPLSGANDGKIVGKVATVGGSQVLTLTLPVRAVADFTVPSGSGDQLSLVIDGIYYRIEGDVNLSTFADTITEVTGGDATTIQTGMPALSTLPAPGWTYRTFRVPGTVITTPKAFLRAKVSETP